MGAGDNGRGRGQTIALPDESGRVEVASGVSFEELARAIRDQAELVKAGVDMMEAVEAFRDATRRYIRHAAGQERYLAPFRQVFRQLVGVLVAAIAASLEGQRDRKAGNDATDEEVK